MITNSLAKADIIMGIKEVPINELIENKEYFFFSHTHKAQPYNMPMLKAVMDKVSFKTMI